MEAINLFSSFSGLCINPMKSEIFCGAMNSENQQQILQTCGFARGSLPIRYLGVPLTASKISARDYDSLVDRIASRIKQWTSKYLSYAGRLQLVKAVLFSLQAFWASIFYLPKKVCSKIKNLMSRFLWSGTSMESHKTKVAWREITRPKREGGLGLCRVSVWNKAALLKHLWNLLFDQEENVWTSWAHQFLIKGRPLWYVKIPDKCS